MQNNSLLEVEAVAKALKELGHATRLSIFRCLVKAGREGMAVGELQSLLQIPGSTLSHHITSLVSADLLHQRREGRTLYCVANYQHLTAVIGFLEDECCRDEQCQSDNPTESQTNSQMDSQAGSCANGSTVK